MLAKLQKYKELQNQKEEQDLKNINDKAEGLINLINSPQLLKIEPELYNITIDYTVIESIPIDKQDQNVTNKKKEMLETMHQISSYNHPYFLQYYGIVVCRQQIKKEIKNEDKNKDKNAVIEKQKQNQKDKKKIKEKDNIKLKTNANEENPDKEKEKEKPKIESIKQEKQKQENIFKKEEKDLNQNKYQLKMKIMAQPKVQKLFFQKLQSEIKTKQQFITRLTFCHQLAEAISVLHQIQYSFFSYNIEQLIMTVPNASQHIIKLPIHNFKIWRMFEQSQLSEIKKKQMTKFKKDALINRSLKYMCPEFLFESIALKDVRLNDIWKVGLIIMSALLGQQLKNQILKLQTIQQAKIKEYKVIEEGKLSKLKKYLKSQDIQILMKTLKTVPAERIMIKLLIPVFKAAIEQLKQNFDLNVLTAAKNKYIEEQKKIMIKNAVQLKPNEQILSNDHRKKITDYFKTAQNKIIKQFKFIYRASLSNFSSRCFYQIAYDRKNLLLVFQQKKEHRKLICYSEQIFDLNKCNGIFGAFIKDPKKLSFIFNPHQNDFCKLKNADKAIGVSYIQGPIIGDGDIVVSDGGQNSSCKFPLSYESLKNKKWLKNEKFDIEQYDVYQMMF